MSLLIGFMTFILVVNCLFLILLVLVQLPKKEAGAGLAFGAGAVDTLIGAGSGNALTKLTKYSATSFLALSILLAVLNAQRSQSSSRALERELSRQSSAAPIFTPQPAPANTGLLNNAAAQVPAQSATNVLQTPASVETNAAAPILSLPATPSTNAPQ